MYKFVVTLVLENPFKLRETKPTIFNYVFINKIYLFVILC